MKDFIHPDDKYKMNWVEGFNEWGTLKPLPRGFDVKSESEVVGDTLRQRFVFTNASNKYLCTSRNSIGIYTPFNDNYDRAEICLFNRCHTHIYCGGDVSYIMALRMNGEAPHLGLVLTEGSLCGYSVERNQIKESCGSNDRGDFILHPSPVSMLAPGESFTVGWTLFWHNGVDDFYSKLALYNPRHVDVKAENYTLFHGEKIRLSITPAFGFSDGDVKITRGEENVAFSVNDGVISVCEDCDTLGERVYAITVGNVSTFCRVLVVPQIEELAAARCKFIAAHQQADMKDTPLDGAFLTYDNEEEHQFCIKTVDYNGARERVGMGALLAVYLKSHPDTALEDSLKRYVAYLEREIVDRESGTVYNDYGRDDGQHRLYNYPLVAQLYLGLYDLWGRPDDLLISYRVMKEFYRRGGSKFYAIDIPLDTLLSKLSAAGFSNERESIMKDFRAHSETILENGLFYPSHEVKFEQSIAAPAAQLMLKMYKVTGEEKYLNGAKKQMAALELFNGRQPDWHLYEVAIRHWDGFWFGKRKLYGDTFPHYWSALTACNYEDFADITGDESYSKRAEAAYRGVLGLFLPNGRASCAYLFPISINGVAAEFYDPFANDQDWGLYFYLRRLEDKKLTQF